MYRPKGFRLCLLLLNSLHALSAEPSYRFETDTNNIAVSASDGGRVYVATDNSLYQFSRSLALEMRVSTGPRLDGPCAQSAGCCVPWRNTTTVNRILVVDEKNKHLLTCGTVRGGACELRQLGNISDFKEDILGRVAAQDLRASTVAFPVRFGGKSYVLTAVTATGEDSRFVPQSCVDNSSYYAIEKTQVYLRLLEGSDFLVYDINFEEPISYLPSSLEHQFVQGFFWNNRFYISLNTNTSGPQIFFAEAPLLRSDAVVNVSCQLTGYGNLQVLSSAHIRTPLSQSFMAVVFSRQKQTQHNALCVYNLEQFSGIKGAEKNQLDRTPLFNYPGLLSVSATLVQNWTVLFLGAEDGLLIKLVLDENMEVIRPIILTELRDESPIRHSILLDKVDPNYLYLLTERMVRRLKVASCMQYSSCEGCLSAQDPYCGWCILEERCSFRSECQEANWINIAKQADSCPKVTLKPVAIDHTLKKELQFTVTLKGSLGNVSKENGQCMLITGNNEVICSGRYNTQCLCKLSDGNYSLLFRQTDPIIINASVKFTSMNFVTSIKLHNCFKNATSHGNNPCTECVNSGCHWCALEHRCSPSCKQPTNQACPHITHAKQSSDTSILISLENAKILENSALKCIFNGKVEYPAKWVNDRAIQCPRPQFVEERRILPVNLAHAANSKNIIDNPNNITVYSCDVQKSNCVFCTPERTCTETTVRSINPDRVGPFGKSILSINGSSLDVGLSATLYVRGMADNITYKSNNCIFENSSLVKCILPEATHGKKSVCLLYDSEKYCSAKRTALLEYVTNIHITSIHPAVSWLRGGRRMKIRGKNLDVLKEMKITVDHKSWINCSNDNGNWTCESPPFKTGAPGNHTVYFYIPGSEQQVRLTYQENPKFYNFTTTVNENQLLITVMRKEDKLQLSKSEIKIYVPRDDADLLECEIKDVTEDKIKCALNTSDPSFSKIEVRLGQYIEHIINPSVSKIPYIALAVILTMLVLFIAIYYYASHRKDKQFSQKLEAQMELLENQFRSQIREGFIELQTEGSDVYLINDYNSIPFLDYKHFAIRTFFPESASEHNEIKFVKDLINTTPQTEQRNSLKEGFNALYSFLNNKQFLVTLIHILEQQKDFTIKDRCRFASFLTIAFHSNLVHLTHVLDQLLKDLMDGSTAQPKLLLRRTETVVEKLLTNWVSLCMYGFLRESVGEPLFKLVSAIKQRISLGPVDAISGKALYTLNEDWLLWQVTDFESLKLDVSFQLNTEADIENDQDNDSGFELDVLNCDTIGQVKEKIFETFFNKYGYSQRFQKEDIDLEHVMNGTHRRLLQDIDQTTQVLEADVKKINTLSHYCIPNGASVVVVRRAKDSKPDTLGDESADNLCHLISPQSVLVESPVPEQGKQKVKVKEMYLTKLLSSKVALQPYVENLFRSIWNIQNSKAPIAIRHIFDILQAQAYNKKITDPDVLHIWKTNSLPLRFWINIIKNPQFVFDIEKTPHLDSCLSVIAQAFMDSFSLSSQHLGKHSPTNKVLYARDVPRYKEEVRNYYRQIADLGSVSKEEMENFLMEESQKHQNEFKEKDAMIELGKYIQKYSAQLESRTESESLQVMREAISEIREHLHHKSSCTWE